MQTACRQRLPQLSASILISTERRSHPTEHTAHSRQLVRLFLTSNPPTTCFRKTDQCRCPQGLPAKTKHGICAHPHSDIRPHGPRGPGRMGWGCLPTHRPPGCPYLPSSTSREAQMKETTQLGGRDSGPCIPVLRCQRPSILQDWVSLRAPAPPASKAVKLQ